MDYRIEGRETKGVKRKLQILCLVDEIADIVGVAHVQAFCDPGVVCGGFLSQSLGDFHLPVRALGGGGDRALLNLETFQLCLHDLLPFKFVEAQVRLAGRAAAERCA